MGAVCWAARWCASRCAGCPQLTCLRLGHSPPHLRLQARKGEADSTPDDILAMVKAQCAPAHRLILFLQQSSVEWCSSLWMHVLQEVDPHYQRTVGGGPGQGQAAARQQACNLCASKHLDPRLHHSPGRCRNPQVMVASKFDNRLKEFSERWEVRRGRAGTELP